MRQRSFWDGLMFGFTASLTLWRDLPAIEAMLVIAVLFGAALVVLRSSETEATSVQPSQSPECAFWSQPQAATSCTKNSLKVAPQLPREQR
jgi:hypothetical protein